MITYKFKNRQGGFILLPVILLLAVIAAIALMMTQKGLVDSKQARNSIDSEQARYTAEAIMQKSVWDLKRNEGCLGYALEETTGQFSHNGYNVGLSTTSGSPVTLDVDIDLGDGATKRFSRVIKMFTAPVSMELTAVEDTNLRENSLSLNYNSEGVKVKYPNTSFGNERRGLLNFDLSSIPSQAIISSAFLKLLLFQSSGFGENKITVNVHQVTASWDSAKVSWKKRNQTQHWSDGGGDFSPTVVASTITDLRAGGSYLWDVLTLVKKWVNGNDDNYGMIMVGEWNEGLQETHDFAEVESGDPLNRPKLIIAYQCECGVPCP